MLWFRDHRLPLELILGRMAKSYLNTRMHTTRMRTTRSLPYRGVCVQGDPPRQRPPPPCEQDDWHTPVKTLPCPKLRLRAVIKHWKDKILLLLNFSLLCFHDQTLQVVTIHIWYVTETLMNLSKNMNVQYNCWCWHLNVFLILWNRNVLIN